MTFAWFSWYQDRCKFWRLCQFHPSIFLLLAGILHPLSLHVCGYLSRFACQCGLMDSYYLTVLIYSDVQTVPSLVRGDTCMPAPTFWVLLTFPRHSGHASLLSGITVIRVHLVLSGHSPGIRSFFLGVLVLCIGERHVETKISVCDRLSNKYMDGKHGESTAVGGTVDTRSAVGVEARSPAIDSLSLALKCLEPRQTLNGSSITTWLIDLSTHWPYLLFDNRAEVTSVVVFSR